jgi:glycosyltransferase involved in cell wall biosynthesis
MRLLFVKESLSWPRTSGHDLYCYYPMRELARLGHEVSLLTAVPTVPEAVAGVPLVLRRAFSEVNGHADGCPPPSFTRLQERFRSYWGVATERVAAVGRTAQECGADAVIVIGLNALPYLAGVRGARRVWYAADEWAWHHLSLVQWARPSTWKELKTAAVKGLYERAYGPLLDAVWVVSEADQRAMRRVAGVGAVDLIPYGVDTDYYCPSERPHIERSCVFWGRLDFEPNVQALEWFCRRVWPALRAEAPGARFLIYGLKAGDAVRALAGRDGVEFTPDLPDLRGEVARGQVVVLPFVSGGGVKSKLLEAAGMGKAILCTPRACNGLCSDGPLPLLTASRPRDWVREILALWSAPERLRELGAKARQWVLRHHTWSAGGRAAAASLERALQGPPR